MSQKRKEITNYRQIERLRYIHESLSSGSYPTTQKLAKDLEASTATISRDIEFLRDRYHAPCEYDPERKGFFYTEPDFQLDLFTPLSSQTSSFIFSMMCVTNIFRRQCFFLPHFATLLYTIN